MTTGATIRLLGAAVAVAGVFLAGCGGPPEPEVNLTTTKPSPTSRATTDASPTSDGPSQVATAYYAAMASNDSERVSEMLETAQEGSPAHLYAVMRGAISQAAAADGLSWPEDDFSTVEDGFQICPEESECATFTDLVADADSGRLRTFKVDGVQINDRLAGPAEPRSAGGSTVEVLGAYRTVKGGALNIALRAASGDRAWSWNLYSAEYVGPDGTQQTAADVLGPVELRPNARATVLISFPAAELGGRLFLEGAVGETATGGGSFTSESFWELEIPIGRRR